jgi:hypothetical protein
LKKKTILFIAFIFLLISILLPNISKAAPSPILWLDWTQTYGGGNTEYGNSVVQTSDGGYAIAGSTHSFTAEGSDVYLVKTDASENLLWHKRYGGTGNDDGESLVQASDGGYAIAGETTSYGAGAR